jgi:hypothetical protein
MKVSFLRTMSAFVLMATLFLTGCSSLKQMPDGTYLGITTVNDTFDRSVSVAAQYEEVIVENRPTYRLKERLQIASGNTFVGQATIGIVSGTGAAIAQGIFAKEIAEIGKCAAGANCGSVYNMSGGTAVSGSTSGSTSGANVHVGTTTPSCGAACSGKHAN